jgi:MFS family permease
MDSDSRVKWRLSGMMALVYSVQGAFWPLLSIHLGDLGISERGRGWIFATMAIASFAMPLGAGQLVDRLMPTQQFISLTFGLGTFLLALMAWGVSSHVGWLFGLFLVYWLVMAPNYTLSNSIAFRHLTRPDRDFGQVRLWGTVAWMAIGWVVSGVMVYSGSKVGRGASEAFWIAVGLSAITALYCRTLPDTPPITTGGRKTSSLGDVSDLVRSPSMPVYLILAFGVSLTTPFVYQVMPNYLRAIGMDRAWVSSAMSLGQWPEVVMLAGLPWLIRRFGYRFTLGLGIAAYAVRFATLAFNPPLWLATAGIPLHGVGVACFTVGGQVFVNRRASDDRKASAQSVNTVVTSGLGSLLGCLLAGEVVAAFPGQFGIIFLVPCAINAGLLLILLLMFRPETVAIPAEAGVRKQDTGLIPNGPRLKLGTTLPS